MQDIRTELNNTQGQNAILVANHFGLKQVKDEIRKMTGDGLANVAMFAAIRLGNTELTQTAAQVVSNSGSYDEEAKKVAEKHCPVL